MFTVAVIGPNRAEPVEIPKPPLGPYAAIVKTEVSFLWNTMAGVICA